jgi:predicted Zn finger-like uncharacterized protein
MIITCPDCATRYDVDDDRFTPNGRSVRCTACGESWFVPAPEEIDVAPIEDLIPSSRLDEKEDGDKPRRGRSRLKVRMDEGSANKRKTNKTTAKPTVEEDPDNARFDSVDADFDDEDDDSLFDAPLTASKAKGKSPKSAEKQDEKPAKAGKRGKAAKDAEKVEKGWRKGRQFIVEDDDAEDRRPFFSRVQKNKKQDDAETPSRRGEAAREALRFADYEDDDGDDESMVEYRDDIDAAEDDYISGDATIVDADWEDVGEHSDRARGFGRRVRTERRRATAVARVEDVRRFDPAYFDEEFFASLRVTPRELEHAVRKARRRAEAREKNRMTPLRAFGWSAWVAAVAGTIYAVVAYRDEIVAIAPQAADAYAVVGIEANPYGLAIENVRHRLAMSTGGPTIEITGNLSNASSNMVAAPLLQAEALGPRGELLSRWTFTPEETQITGGGAVAFVTRAPAPEGVTEVALSFAPTKTAVSNLLSGGGE